MKRISGGKACRKESKKILSKEGQKERSGNEVGDITTIDNCFVLKKKLNKNYPLRIHPPGQIEAISCSR